MSSGIYIAAAGAVAQSVALDATANNIANASTAGYQGERVSFKEALGSARSADVAMVATSTAHAVDGTNGALMQTDNPLDVALEGDGVFAVKTPQGMRYTRAGNFQLNADKQLVTQDGFQVMGQGNQPITLPPEASTVTIGADGDVNADGNIVGKLALARFAPSQLKREGGSLFSATGTPRAGEQPKVRTGVLESSNVNIVRGVVDLVKVSRTYESLMKMIQGYHDVETRAARELGGPK
ncbi:MAG TPA: flagellar basal-body rod protein FlgF [Kofleriaceae bacterium]|nr:flagellar basal-body rod protein FlgF [Kofleriaceae bacterium]